MKLHTNTLFVVLLAVACSRDTEPSDVKMVGVGLDPDTIGPAPRNAGGILEYDWLNVAGDQIPLGILGYSILDPSGPDFSGFNVPYAWVTAVSFFFGNDQVAPDVAFGNFAVPPTQSGSCHMVVEPGSGGIDTLADAGDHLGLVGGDMDVTMERYPPVYPADPQDVFPYYQYNNAWRPEASYTYVRTDPDSQDPYALEKQVLESPNFVHGQALEVSFPGTIPPIEANSSSIPVPLSPEGAQVQLPHRSKGVRLSWDGPRYDRFGGVLAGEGEQAACLQFKRRATDPASTKECEVDEAFLAEEILAEGNLYTAPWETDAGVTFEWTPQPASDDTVSITVRFLGPMSDDEEFLVDPYVAVTPNSTVTALWKTAQDADYDSDGFYDVPPGAPVPEGYRSALPCDDPEDIVWEAGRSFVKEDGTYLPSVQGNPQHNLIELTCTVSDAEGKFVLTEELLAPALDYADLHDAEGAVFYFSRRQQHDLSTPDVRDNYGNKHVTSDLIFVSNSVDVGRFWYAR